MLYLIISFLASVFGAVCGIGGGVVIKPVLDLFDLADVSTISFLSGCTVLAMSAYSVIKNSYQEESAVAIRFCTPLAVGGAIGGTLGKLAFEWIIVYSASPQLVKGIQSYSLAVIVFCVLVYTLIKSKVKARKDTGLLLRVLIGVVLGVISAFLGVGGGPINLAVLFYFFGMDMKAAAGSSLYIILVSQIMSLVTAVVTNTIPKFSISVLLLMIFGGVCGGAAGARLNNRMTDKQVEKLFVVLMVIIIGISIYNGTAA